MLLVARDITHSPLLSVRESHYFRLPGANGNGAQWAEESSYFLLQVRCSTHTYIVAKLKSKSGQDFAINSYVEGSCYSKYITLTRL